MPLPRRSSPHRRRTGARRRTGGTAPGLPRRLVAIVLGTALTLGAAPAAASAQDDEPDAWGATAELSFTRATGNQRINVLTTAFQVTRRAVDMYGFELNMQARYGSSEDERLFENYKGELNLDMAPVSERWSPFLYSTAERDRVNRLDMRVNSGAGAMYKLYRSDDRGEAALRVAMSYSYEAVRADEPLDPTQTALWSLRLNGRQQIRDGVTLTHSTHYQPVYDELSDYLLSVQTTLKVMVTSRVALSVSHEYDRDSVPPPDVGPTDELLKAGILVEL